MSDDHDHSNIYQKRKNAIKRAVIIGVASRGSINIEDLVNLISPEPQISRQEARNAIADAIHDGLMDKDSEGNLTVEIKNPTNDL